MGFESGDRETLAIRSILLDRFALVEPMITPMVVLESGETTDQLQLRRIPILPVAVLETSSLSSTDENGQRVDILPDTIIRMVAEEFAVSDDALLGTSRQRIFVNPRQLCMYLLREFVGPSMLSYSEIAKVFGKDHTTVISAVKVWRDKLERAWKTPESVQDQMRFERVKARILDPRRTLTAAEKERQLRTFRYQLVGLSYEGLSQAPWVDAGKRPKLLNSPLEAAIDMRQADRGLHLYRKYGNTALKLLQNLAIGLDQVSLPEATDN